MDKKEFNIPQALAGQFPYRLLRSNLAYCEWLQNMPQNFTEPFFDETISRLKWADENRSPFKMLAHTDMLLQWSAHLPHTKPAAIIFHVSRCGSTLFSQLLSLQQQYMVLAEVPFFDELLRLPFKNNDFSKEEASGLFDAALQLYINSSPQKPEQVFIKADSWHLHFYEQLRALYPATPFILLYRQPFEVLQSQQKRRGIQSVPGLIEPAVFGFTATQANEYDLDKYMNQVLISYFTKMLQIATVDSNSLLVNYNQGAMDIMEKITSTAAIPFDDNYQQQTAERSGFHAKYPKEVFAEALATTNIPTYLAPTIKAYETLDALRLLQQG